MNNLWSQEYSQLCSHAQYKVKLSIIMSLEQQESLLRRDKYEPKCLRNPPFCGDNFFYHIFTDKEWKYCTHFMCIISTENPHKCYYFYYILFC